ncbi:MAG: hypothetical protein AAGE86_12445 [Pseudomonadota bacterium]
MASTSTHRPFLLVAPGLLALASTACSSGSDVTAADGPESEDPPGSALPLSIGGRASADGESVFEISVNCAAALDLTAERLAQMADNPRSEEIALLGRAEDHFEARAEGAQADDPDIITSPAAAIARRRNEKADEASEQAQLAIACLRRFGDEVG